MLIVSRHTYVLNTILTDKETTFTAVVMQRTIEQARIKFKHTTLKHAQTIGMTEGSHQKLKKILKINVSADQPP